MTEVLVKLPSVARVSNRVIRILGQNPGKFTLQGTNTYLVSSPPPPPPTMTESLQSIPAILVDAAEGKDTFFPLLRSALLGEHRAAQQQGCAVRRYVTHILLSHWHPDHVKGLPSLLQGLTQMRRELGLGGPPPYLCKFRNPDYDDDIETSIAHLAEGVDFSRGQIRALTFLEDDARLEAGDDATLRLLHTPGHTTDHLSLLLEEEGVLFSGDNVLGQGSSTFEDLSAYLSSLQRSLDVLDAQAKRADQEQQILPGHGPVLPHGRAAIRECIDHRMNRERQIVELLSRPGPSEDMDATTDTYIWSITDIVKDLYAAYPASLYPAAARGIFLHLHKLSVEGKVKCIGMDASPSGQAPPVSPLKTEHMELSWSLSGKGKL